jgi:hypothetical protein
MKPSCAHPSGHRLLLIAILITATAPLATATTLTANQLADLMLENQGDNAEFIALIFGPDKTSALTFSSTLNSTATLFSYSLTPVIYLGQTLNLTGTGSFDTTTGVLQLNSSGSLGTLSWTTTGTDTISVSGTDLNVTTQLNFLKGGAVKSADVEATGFVRADGSTGGFGFHTDENGDPIPGTTRIFKDSQQNSTGAMAYSSSTVGLGYGINISGSSPPGGGAGTTTGNIIPIPEPSTFFLLSSGFGLATVFLGNRFPKQGK